MTRRLLVRLAPGERSTICAECGEPADQPLYRHAICALCLDELAARDAARHALRGYGRRVEPATTPPEVQAMFPAAYVDLMCTSCSATFYGPRAEPCPWCAEALDRMRRDQAELLLRPELPDVDDVRHDGAVKAWGQRLARGVVAGLLTEQQALAAWRKVVTDDFCAA